MARRVAKRSAARARHLIPVILVVEDEFLVREAAAEHLRACGFRVLEAVTVEEAIHLLGQSTSIVAVFADVKLPGPHSGADLARVIRQDCPEVKVLLTSGVVQMVGSELEGVALLKKPYPLSEMERLLRELIGLAAPL
jgi:CheY-like chemotaxis protein